MNAYLHYRKAAISRGSGLSMTQHSKDTGSSWRGKDDSQKREHYQAAARDAVKKEIASGGNGLTKKTFEQHGNIAFVNEVPIVRQPVVQHDEDWFNQYINYE